MAGLSEPERAVSDGIGATEVINQVHTVVYAPNLMMRFGGIPVNMIVNISEDTI